MVRNKIGFRALVQLSCVLHDAASRMLDRSRNWNRLRPAWSSPFMWKPLTTTYVPGMMSVRVVPTDSSQEALPSDQSKPRMDPFRRV